MVRPLTRVRVNEKEKRFFTRFSCSTQGWVVLSGVTMSDVFYSLFVLTSSKCSQMKSMLSKACFSYYLSWTIYSITVWSSSTIYDKILSWWWYILTVVLNIMIYRKQLLSSKCEIDRTSGILYTIKISLKIRCLKKAYICSTHEKKNCVIWNIVVLRVLHNVWPCWLNSIFSSLDFWRLV